MKINARIIFCLLVILAGVAYYILWNLKYNAWSDIGIYSVSVFFIGFGFLGLLYSIIKTEREKT
ncbi:MAG: hypothetical protein H5T44_03545 [Thermoplasmatales archaeon]|nr:hypothetical protein [Thermoplasmatales archaeon]